MTFPAGITAPKRIRIYRRSTHYILQWYDSGRRRNASERVDGDLVAAIARAREIDRRLDEYRTAGTGHRRLTHAELVTHFKRDLHQRADAGELDLKTVARYQSALTHYTAFLESGEVAKRYPIASRIDRQFVLEFAAFLKSRRISPNGHPHTSKRPMASTAYVENVASSMFAWAGDAERGNLLPDGFRNPFARRARRSTQVAPDPSRPPDITMDMAAEFLGKCDRDTLPYFTLLALYGLRPSELTLLFREHINAGWLHVRCDLELGLLAKGRRDKSLPLLPGLPIPIGASYPTEGLLFGSGRVTAQCGLPLLGASLQELRAIFRERCAREGQLTSENRASLLKQLLKDAGALQYDEIEQRFQVVARCLKFPRAATLKDFRHLCNTNLQNAGVPEVYRRFLLGHSLGRSALVNYSHLTQLRHWYEKGVELQMQPIVEAVRDRAGQIGLLPLVK